MPHDGSMQKNPKNRSKVRRRRTVSWGYAAECGPTAADGTVEHWCPGAGECVERLVSRWYDCC
jgi:hypothetical protein